jgi:hypothetical protein
MNHAPVDIESTYLKDFQSEVAFLSPDNFIVIIIISIIIVFLSRQNKKTTNIIKRTKNPQTEYKITYTLYSNL